MRKTTNAARALHDLSRHASQYVPISNVPRYLPGYVSIDPMSTWHTSALLATAVESVTLPCRLRGDGRKRTTFDDFEVALNTNGNQRIARLTFSVLNPLILEDKLRQDRQISRRDPRVGNSQNTYALTGEDDEEEADLADTGLDVDLLPGEFYNSYWKQSGKAAHVFGAVDSLRGPFMVLGSRKAHGDEEYGRKRRRLVGMSVIERQVLRLLSLRFSCWRTSCCVPAGVKHSIVPTL